MHWSDKSSGVHYHKSAAGPILFTDAMGARWTVHEIPSPSMLSGTPMFRAHPERRTGWLLFESRAGESRRLAPYPADWRSLSPYVLERWCMRAVPVGPDENRRRDDAPSAPPAA